MFSKFRDIINFCRRSARLQAVLVLTSGSDVDAALVRENVLQALVSSGLHFDAFDIDSAEDWPDFKHYTCLVIATSRLECLSKEKTQRIYRYVRKGGAIVTALPICDPLHAPLFGLVACSQKLNQPGVDGESISIRFIKDLYPGLKGLLVSFPFVAPASTSTLCPKANAEIIAEGPNDTPIAWMLRRGAGRVVVWNTKLFGWRSTRGLIVQSILSAQPVGVQPIVNAGVIQIDDFPAGLVDQELEPARSEFDLSLIDFLDRVWLPDILSLGNDFGLEFTFFIPFAYNALIEPPFDFAEWEDSKVTREGKEVSFSVDSCRRTGAVGELGLHGYNHLPLRLNAWKSRERMVEALECAIQRWKSDELGPLPTSYVPAMNEFDEVGAEALVEAVPSIKTICGSFIGDYETGGDRDFGPEPWNPALFSLPRVTFGYIMSPELHFDMLSCLATMGVWTHFFHPDDVFDNPINNGSSEYHRNPKSLNWRAESEAGSMYAELRQWMSTAVESYPWLRFLETTVASKLIQEHLSSNVDVKIGELELLVSSDNPIDFQVKISASLTIETENLTEIELVHKYSADDYQMYTLRSLVEDGRELRIPLKRTMSDGEV